MSAFNARRSRRGKIAWRRFASFCRGDGGPIPLYGAVMLYLLAEPKAYADLAWAFRRYLKRALPPPSRALQESVTVEWK